MSSRRRFLLSVLCALVLSSPRPAAAQVAVGDAFPRLDQIAFEGAAPATAGQVVLVDFWASWCGPCKASFPALAQIHADYASRGVVILAVSVDEKPTAYAAFVKKHAPPFATVRDHERQLVTAVQVPAMPTSFVIGRDGRVRAVLRGYHGAKTEAALRTALDAALAIPPSPSS